MKVIISCSNAKAREVIIELLISQLHFDFEKGVFGVPACSYDLFYTMRCELDIKPQEIVCSNSETHIYFANPDDATAFAEWLKDTAEKARKSFFSMAG